MRVVESWMPNFLALLRSGVPEVHAARMARVGWDRIVEKKRTDQEFSDQFEAAKAVARTI